MRLFLFLLFAAITAAVGALSTASASKGSGEPPAPVAVERASMTNVVADGHLVLIRIDLASGDRCYSDGVALSCLSGGRR